MKIETPECDKLAKIRENSQDAGAFVDWLFHGGYIQKTRKYKPNMEQLLAKFFDIDLDKVDTEKRAILQWYKTV